MFTGIVEELGAVRALDGGRLVVACPLVATDSPVGASVAVKRHLPDRRRTHR